MMVRATCFLSFLLLGACAPAAPGKLSSNGLVLDFEVLDDLSTSALTTSGTFNESTFGPLLATEHGEELFSYLMTCALDEGQEITVPSTNKTYTGNLGLAPEWISESCTNNCQEWVSACILAHTNEIGKSVIISPRGSHTSLEWNDEIEDDFDHEEAAYYGNLFLPISSRVAVVCAGRALLSTNFNVQPFLDGRTHSSGTTDILFSGFCGSETILAPAAACNSTDLGYYSDCRIDETTDDVFDSGPRSNHVITVFLNP